MSAKILSGRDMSAGLVSELKKRSEKLIAHGTNPCISVIRVGAREDDLAYERSIAKRSEAAGVLLNTCFVEEASNESALLDCIERQNRDPKVHGILLLRPIPRHFDEDKIYNAIDVRKDIDGVSDSSMAGLYSVRDDVFAPCTAEAVIAMCEYYDIELKGKNVVVIGRSTVIGKPVSMLLLSRNATVTICHTKTQNLSDMTRAADIVVVAAGLAGGGRDKALGAEYFGKGQIVFDVGINVDDAGLYGDIDTDAASEIVSAITPVPGGIGAVTTTLLLEHVIRSAEMQ